MPTSVTSNSNQTVHCTRLINIALLGFGHRGDIVVGVVVVLVIVVVVHCARVRQQRW